MIKIETKQVYDYGTTTCDACGRVLGKDKYEQADIIKMAKNELTLCQKCSHALHRKLGRTHKGGWS